MDSDCTRWSSDSEEDSFELVSRRSSSPKAVSVSVDSGSAEAELVDDAILAKMGDDDDLSSLESDDGEIDVVAVDGSEEVKKERIVRENKLMKFFDGMKAMKKNKEEKGRGEMEVEEKITREEWDDLWSQKEDAEEYNTVLQGELAECTITIEKQKREIEEQCDMILADKDSLREKEMEVAELAATVIRLEREREDEKMDVGDKIRQIKIEIAKSNEEAETSRLELEVVALAIREMGRKAKEKKKVDEQKDELIANLKRVIELTNKKCEIFVGMERDEKKQIETIAGLQQKSLENKLESAHEMLKMYENGNVEDEEKLMRQRVKEKEQAELIEDLLRDTKEMESEIAALKLEREENEKRKEFEMRDSIEKRARLHDAEDALELTKEKMALNFRPCNYINVNLMMLFIFIDLFISIYNVSHHYSSSNLPLFASGLWLSFDLIFLIAPFDLLAFTVFKSMTDGLKGLLLVFSWGLFSLPYTLLSVATTLVFLPSEMEKDEIQKDIFILEKEVEKRMMELGEEEKPELSTL